ncbi:MAG: hypothetical protein KAY37_07080 [Phycisphaerae bacterium]|nr:hypothetical protein [Phycisphaerae bacterium]
MKQGSLAELPERFDLMEVQMYRSPVALAVLALTPGVLAEVTVSFDLLTWNDSQATVELPSAVGWRPLPSDGGDWLLFTEDDLFLWAEWNPLGAVSHNFPDVSGTPGSGYTNAPSLSGISAITMELSCAAPAVWAVQITDQFYTGQINPVMRMKQLLVTPGSPATTNGIYNVDGLPNNGTWSASAASDWSISYQIDFYFAGGIDDPDPQNPDLEDIDVTFDDALQQGYLIPVAMLTPAGMAAVELDDPAGFFGGDFEQYLLDEITPRLPDDATYLLVTQMEKSHPVYAEEGVPLTTDSLIGNTTIAYTTQVIPGQGDADGDGAVDLLDYVGFEDCLAGPGATPEGPQCLCVFDFDEDGDVDLSDFAAFQEVFVE